MVEVNKKKMTNNQDSSNNLLDDRLMIEAAQADTGLFDFGDENIEPRLARLVERVNNEVTFKSDGQAQFRAVIHRLLVNRLRMRADVLKHPEILDEEIIRPIIIIGLPRSGTTKLQRMISASADVQKMSLWRILNPARFPNTMPGKPDPRIMAITEGTPGAEDFEAQESLQAAHAMGAIEADEDIILIDLILDFSVCGSCMHLPLFFADEWLGGCDEREIDQEGYDFLRTVLQYLQWQEGSQSQRPWILKAPAHSTHLVALTQTFPDATLVQCHRDPCKVIPSAAKLMTTMWQASTEFDSVVVGQSMYRWARTSMQRCFTARRQLGIDDSVLDVHFSDIRKKMMPVIEEIFRRNGCDLTEQAKVEMLAWEQDNEQGKHGKHTYSLEEFELDEAEVRASFADYIERFSTYF